MDLRSLLDVPVDAVKKPSTWPAGLYHGHIEKYEPGESREKKTPFLRVFVRVTRADESVPEDLLKDSDGKPFDLSKRSLRKDFYLTEDAKWRLVEMIQAVGVETEGKSLSGCLPELLNKPVQIEITLRGSQDGKELFNEIGSLTAEAD